MFLNTVNQEVVRDLADFGYPVSNGGKDFSGQF